MNTERLKARSVRVMSVLAIVFSLAIVAEPVHAQVVQITVRLNGAQEVPPVTTTGRGVARLTVNTTTRAISGNISFTNLSTPATAGHVHLGAVGANGAVAIPLIGGVGARTGRMRIPPARVLTAAQMRALRRNGLYINIHTSTNPGGEIRGQIRFPRPARAAALSQPVAPALVSGNLGLGRTGDGLVNLKDDGNLILAMNTLQVH